LSVRVAPLLFPDLSGPVSVSRLPGTDGPVSPTGVSDRCFENEGFVMALAVKTPDTTSSGLLDRFPVAVALGVAYILGSIGIVFALLPKLWWEVLSVPRGSATTVLLIILGVAVTLVLGYLGARLVGPTPRPGLRGGVAVALLCLLVVVILGHWVSGLIEQWTYDGALPTSIGQVLTVALPLVLLVVLFRFLFFGEKAEARMSRFEEQGWFSAKSYKKSQGLLVRRGTVLAIWLLVGCGIYSLHAHQSLDASADWSVKVPFSDSVDVVSPGESGLVKDGPSFLANITPGKKLNPVELKKINDELHKEYAYVVSAGDAEQLTEGEVVKRSYLAQVQSELKEKGSRDRSTLPTVRPPAPVTANTAHTDLILLPHVRFSLPLLLAALAIWFGWRAVNMPMFADFLIATEAELNKVSWTSSRRLVQDTIVVLVTVVMMAIFLMLADVLWSTILKTDIIGVLHIPKATEKKQLDQDQNW
jgi:preprotein translocase SecE subunit